MLILFIITFIFLLFLHYKDYSFNTRTVLGLVLGITVGSLYNITNQDSNSFMQMGDILGNGYISLLKMLVVPIVLTSIIHSIINLKDHKSEYIVKVAYKSISILLVLTGISALIGASVAIYANLGKGLDIASITGVASKHLTPTSFSDTILSFLPDNVFHQMSTNNVMAVVIFAIILGFSILIAHREDEKLAAPFINFMDSAFFVIKKLAKMVIGLTPYGVLGLMVQISTTLNQKTITTVIYFIFACYVAMLLVYVMHIILLIVFKTDIKRFYKYTWGTLLVAATSRSSMGTLPVTIEGLNKYGTSETIATFTPTIATTMGMNACAGVFPSVLAIMAMQSMGIPITFSVVFTMAFICMLASLGVSGIPGTAYVAAGVVFSYFGLPWALIGLIIGVDAIVDSFRTPLNIHGAMTTAIIVDKTTSKT
jgi:L-cystine uptake protein TcyP (sodium:dicarboxylate symporter family)